MDREAARGRMRAKERYDSLVARGVRGAEVERAFGAMCQPCAGRRRVDALLAACVDAATHASSPRQLESEFRTFARENWQGQGARVFEQTTLPVYLGLAGNAWWKKEVRRVAVRPSWRYRLFFEEDEDLEPTDRRPVPLRGTRLASTVHKSIAGRLEHALHAWAARHWPDRVLHLAIAAGGSHADVAAHAAYMAVPDAPADVTVVHVRSSVVAPEEADEDEEPTRPLTDFSDDVPPPLEATATPGDVDEKLVRSTVVGPRRPWVVKTTGCRVVCRWAGSLASFAAGVTSSTCDNCETPEDAQALAWDRVAEKTRGPYERVAPLDGRRRRGLRRGRCRARFRWPRRRLLRRRRRRPRPRPRLRRRLLRCPRRPPGPAPDRPRTSARPQALPGSWTPGPHRTHGARRAAVKMDTPCGTASHRQRVRLRDVGEAGPVAGARAACVSPRPGRPPPS